MNYISRKIGLCICAVQLIASAVFFVALWLMNLLPAKYVTIIGTGTSAFLCMRGIHTASF